MKQRVSQAIPDKASPATLAHDIEAALVKIPGVLCAGVTMDDDAAISEIHLVSSYAKRPKALVRDTESLLHAQFSLNVDYRCISVVQIPTEDDAPLSRRSLRFVSAGPSADDEGLIEVILGLEGTRFRGAVRATDASQEAVCVAAGQATLQAVQWAYELDITVLVQEAHIVPSAFCPVCVSVVQANTRHGQEMLTGTCFETSGICDAGAKSVLDAINRRVTFWVRSQTLASGG